MRLFVDCDDTLVLWKYATEGDITIAQSYDENTKLKIAVKKWKKEHPSDTLIIWSGGGLNYAKRWADKFFMWYDKSVMVKGYDFALSKDVTLPTDEDICIDDQEGLKVKGKLYTWQEFVKLA